MGDEGLRISELAGLIGTTARTLRYYESIDLIIPDRTARGARRYGTATSRRVEQIVKLRRLGMSVGDIASTLAESENGNINAPVLAEKLKLQLAELDRRRGGIIAALDQLGFPSNP